MLGECEEMITDSLAFNAFESIGKGRWQGGISVGMFERPRHLREAALRLLTARLLRSGCRSAVALVRDDPSLFSLAAHAGLRSGLPAYMCDSHESESDLFADGPPPDPSALIVPSVASGDHALGLVREICSYGAPVSLVIAIVDKSQEEISLPDGDFTSLCSLGSLRERISCYRNVAQEGMGRAMDALG